MVHLRLFVVVLLFQFAISKVVPKDKGYITVMDRIVAVNDAQKRSLETNQRPQHQNIESINEKKHLNLFQGDIILDTEEEERLSRHDRTKRNGLRRRYEIWISRVVPYYIPYNMAHIRTNVLAAINEFHQHTCVRFVPYAGHANYIKFVDTAGCSSKIGKKYVHPGAQELSISNGCNYVGTILHELMHALGFFHEQARNDRDKYVKVNWENIMNGRANQFEKYNDFTIDKLGKQYDYESIMHYGRLTFSKNGKPTIVRINDENTDFGRPDDRLSTLDIAEINELYDCSATTSYGWAQWSRFTPCDESCYKSRERYCYHPGTNKQYCGGNVNVYGSEKEKVKCSSSECPVPVDGNWGRWGVWGQCSKTCGDGIHKRVRTCSNPAPKHAGRNCVGSSTEVKVCTIARCHLDYDDTEFEGTLGMWMNSANDKLNWQLNRWFVQTGGTGPNGDHTTGSGYYLYMESSTPRQAGDNAKLITPWLPKPPPGGQCLKFHYSMNGNTMGSLTVKLEENGGTSWYTFYKSGHQSDQWLKGMGNINTNHNYRLTIEATIGKPGYSDIAIDDVYIDAGLCDCQDDYVTCRTWLAAGECARNSLWMHPHCQRSCNTCGCKDSDSRCSNWASVGECQKNPSYMLVSCIASCNVCACHDDNTKCMWWASQGECTKNPTYMKDQCKRSCKVCS